MKEEEKEIKEEVFELGEECIPGPSHALEWGRVEYSDGVNSRDDKNEEVLSLEENETRFATVCYTMISEPQMVYDSLGGIEGTKVDFKTWQQESNAFRKLQFFTGIGSLPFDDGVRQEYVNGIEWIVEHETKREEGCHGLNRRDIITSVLETLPIPDSFQECVLHTFLELWPSYYADRDVYSLYKDAQLLYMEKGFPVSNAPMYRSDVWYFFREQMKYTHIVKIQRLVRLGFLKAYRSFDIDLPMEDVARILNQRIFDTTSEDLRNISFFCMNLKPGITPLCKTKLGTVKVVDSARYARLAPNNFDPKSYLPQFSNRDSVESIIKVSEILAEANVLEEEMRSGIERLPSTCDSGTRSRDADLNGLIEITVGGRKHQLAYVKGLQRDGLFGTFADFALWRYRKAVKGHFAGQMSDVERLIHRRNREHFQFRENDNMLKNCLGKRKTKEKRKYNRKVPLKPRGKRKSEVEIPTVDISILSSLRCSSDVDSLFPSQLSAHQFLLGCGILKTDVRCSRCGEEMFIGRRGTRDELTFLCRVGAKKNCSFRSILSHSFFFRMSNTKLTIRSILKMLVCWIQKCDYKTTMQECAVSEVTASEYFVYFRRICSRLVSKSFSQIGGYGRIVECGKIMVLGIKNVPIRPTVQIRLFCGIDRESGKIFVEIVRDGNTVEEIISKKIAEGSELHIDMRNNYSIGKEYTVKYRWLKSINTKIVDDSTVSVELLNDLFTKIININGGNDILVDSFPRFLDEFILRFNLEDQFASAIWKYLADFHFKGT